MPIPRGWTVTTWGADTTARTHLLAIGTASMVSGAPTPGVSILITGISFSYSSNVAFTTGLDVINAQTGGLQLALIVNSGVGATAPFSQSASWQGELLIDGAVWFQTGVGGTSSFSILQVQGEYV